MKKCINYKKYKGEHKPQCNDGNGCTYCKNKFKKMCDCYSHNKLHADERECYIYCERCGKVFFNKTEVILSLFRKMSKNNV